MGRAPVLVRGAIRGYASVEAHSTREKGVYGGRFHCTQRRSAPKLLAAPPLPP